MTGPRKPRNFVPDSPQKSTENILNHFFIPESDVSDSASEDGDSTMTYSKKVTTQRPRKFKFRKFLKKQDEMATPKSSPDVLPDLEVNPIIISSDEELERSMLSIDC